MLLEETLEFIQQNVRLYGLPYRLDGYTAVYLHRPVWGGMFQARERGELSAPGLRLVRSISVPHGDGTWEGLS